MRKPLEASPLKRRDSECGLSAQPNVRIEQPSHGMNAYSAGLSRRAVLAAGLGGALAGCGGGAGEGGKSAPPDAQSQTISEIYLDRHSALPGDTVAMYVNASTEGAATIRLLDPNGRQVDRIRADVKPQTITGDAPWRDGFGYVDPVAVTVGALKSGLYFWEGIGRMIVRSAAKADICVLYPSNTECAYNAAGGKSFYVPPPPLHGCELSFQRPWSGATYKYSRGFYEWLATVDGYSLDHIADHDLENPETLAQCKLLIVVGHSEYWSRRARLAFDRFVDAGGHALILSGNTMWWQIRYSADGGRLICYKDSRADPVTDPRLDTINWPTPSLGYPVVPSIGADFNGGGFGRQAGNGWKGMKVVAPSSAIFAGAAVAYGEVLQMPSSEYDGAPVASVAPDGTPILDKAALGFYRADLIGYDIAYRSRESFATWIAFRKTPHSGIVINCAANGWCAQTGMQGVDGERLRIITKNMIDLLLAGIYPVS